MAKIVKFKIYSWNVKAQDWVYETQALDAKSAKKWAKKQSNVYTKRFKVIKEEVIGEFEDDKQI